MTRRGARGHGAKQRWVGARSYHIIMTLLHSIVVALAAVAPAPMPLAPAAQTLPASDTTTLALVGASVRTMLDDRLAPDQTVVIRDGRIVAVGPRASTPIPAGARRVEVQGRTVIPGLTDAHVHLEGTPEQWLPLFVVHGVTTVFNLQGRPEHVALRERVRRGELVGPAIYTTGPYTNNPAIGTPEEAVRAVEEHKRVGYDMVKVYGNMTAETHRALTDAGRRHGIPVMGHAPRNLPFAAVIDARQAMVAHGEELIYTHFRDGDTTDLAAVAARMVAADVWLTPNRSFFCGIAAQWGRATGADSSLALPEAAYLNGFLHGIWTASNPYTRRDPAGAANVATRYQFLRTLTRTFGAVGVRMLAGTDTPLPLMFPGYSLHDELAELAAAGLGGHGALLTAPRNPAEWIAAGIDRGYRGGVVAVGARADLLVLERDPVATLEAARRPIGVVLAGRWLDRAALDRLHAEAIQASRASR